MKKFLKQLGYQGEILDFVTRKLCGIWFLWIGLITIVGTVFSNHMCINPPIFILGYAVGFYVCYGNRNILFKRLANGKQSKFQEKMSNIALRVLVLLCIVVGSFNWYLGADTRTIWLGIFLAVGIHFFAFYFVHGMPVVILGGLCTMYAVVGLIVSDIPFYYIGAIDGITKMGVGLYLFLNAVKNNKKAFYRKYFA